MSIKYAAPVFAALLLSGCASSSRQPAGRAQVTETATCTQKTNGAPISADLLNAVAWTQNAVEHDLVFLEIYHDAQKQMLEALHDKSWDALAHDERQNDYTNLKPAVILDVDETVLDNSAYEARLIRQHKEYNAASFGAWVEEEKDVPLPGALAFTKFAARHGVRVFYLSNRDRSLDKATLDNLRKLGFPVQNKSFLGAGTYVKGCDQLGSQKTCRRELIGRHYRVLMQFGDQVGDFMTELNNTTKGRREAITPYLRWIGTRWFVLPNPMYGSWEPAMFNNDWEQPANMRRKAKIHALHTDGGAP